MAELLKTNWAICIYLIENNDRNDKKNIHG